MEKALGRVPGFDLGIMLQNCKDVYAFVLLKLCSYLSLWQPEHSVTDSVGAIDSSNKEFRLNLGHPGGEHCQFRYFI